MNLCRFKNKTGKIRVGLVAENATLLDLTPAGVTQLTPLFENENSLPRLAKLSEEQLPRIPLNEAQLLAPVERQEVWAAGVTYLRSKTARMEESDFGATAYDKVYSAERPEIFFKSLAEKVMACGEAVGIRRDAKWSVPEPELALILNSHGKIVGYTIGNDMSSRDIEGENLLYLPQAKIYYRSCALGPWIHLGSSEAEAREWRIKIEIRRGGQIAFAGETYISNIVRDFNQLAEFLFRSQRFPHGAVLLTGTGVVPPENFTLQALDEIEIEVNGIGLLKNSVLVV
jgi:2-dehydro-3-deoxy-D-arabinonate dehydratase